MLAAFPPKCLIYLIARYPVEPRLESPVILQASQFMERVQKDVLSQILGILPVIDHPKDKIQNSPAILFMYRVERLNVTGACSSNDLGLFSLQRLLDRRHSAQN
jgi:hypothetical protein